mmetsp:Transcript_7962/g.19584  ORF Transcript_7962/g.19584 Transcript_7962/m.19584 type:complete len:243 (-) Transcript_7962:821-1549(-)
MFKRDCLDAATVDANVFFMMSVFWDMRSFIWLVFSDMRSFIPLSFSVMLGFASLSVVAAGFLPNNEPLFPKPNFILPALKLSFLGFSGEATTSVVSPSGLFWLVFNRESFVVETFEAKEFFMLKALLDIFIRIMLKRSFAGTLGFSAGFSPHSSLLLLVNKVFFVVRLIMDSLVLDMVVSNLVLKSSVPVLKDVWMAAVLVTTFVFISMSLSFMVGLIFCSELIFIFCQKVWSIPPLTMSNL